MPGIISNFAKAVRPVVAAAGENLDGLVCDMNLRPVAIKLDFVNPALAGGDVFYRTGKGGMYEPRKRGLDPGGSRFLTRIPTKNSTCSK